MCDNRDEEGEEVNNLNPWISNAGHPLVNPVVASTLFEVMTLPELRTLRLVCKDWLSVSLPIWRRTVQINIHYWSPNQRLLQWKFLGTELDIAGEKPFRNFYLDTPQFLAANSKPYVKSHLRTLIPEDLGTYRIMEQFWANYGHWIHKLELKQAYVADVDAFKRAIFEQTPNLLELTLDQIIDGMDAEASNTLPVQGNEDDGPVQPNLKAFRMKRRTKLPFGWKLFFTRFPNIQKLDLREDYKRSSLDEVAECLGNMLTSPARRPNLPITDLRWEVLLSLDGPFEKLLRNPQVKLKVLHLTLFGHSDKNFGMLRTVMDHHGNTLKELHLQNYCATTIDFWKSVVGPYASLTELQVKGSALARNFHFLHKFPNLKVLRLEQKEDDEMLMNTNWRALKAMPHLREFYFVVTEPEESEEDVLPEEILEILTKVMPNLESFTGQLTNLTLRVVCRNWRRLKKLVILSGWTFDSMDEFEERFGNTLDINDVGITGIVRGSDKRVPCVADLQELRHLTLEHVTKIGDASVSEGFLKLPHLSSLDICNTNEIMTGLGPLKKHLQGGLTRTPLLGG